mgnify:FL=1
MRQLILLYWGCVFLMYLSQAYYPTSAQLNGPQIGKRHFMLRKADIFMAAVIVWMTCFSFLRTSYNDTYNYIFLWENAKSIKDFLADGELLDLTGNPLSMLWESFAHTYIGNYHLYFLLPAFLSGFAVIKLLKRYSVNPAFSLLIFFSVGTYIMYMAAMKQCFAMFFLLLSIPYAEEKKYLRFYALVAISIFFHTHAFMFAILPLLFSKPWGKTTWIGLAAVMFAMATYDKTLGAFMNYAQSIGALVDEGELFDGHQINFLRIIVYWMPSLLALAFRGRLFKNSTRSENLFVNMAIVSSMILTLGMVQAANLFARMAAYFEIATAIAIPWMIKKLFTKRSAQYVTVCAVVLYFGYFLYEFAVSKNFGSDYSAITLWQFILELVRPK